jgi:hypothetical protein
MAETSVLKVNSVQVSDDGGTLRVSFAQPNGGEAAITCPSDQVPIIMSLLVQAAQHVARIKQSDPRLKTVFPVSWWEIALHPDGKHLVLTFKVEENFELSFQIHRDAGQRYLEVLSGVLNPQTVAPSEGPVQ